MGLADMVNSLLTISLVQAAHCIVSISGLVSDTEDEADEDFPGSQVMGSQGMAQMGKGRAKRFASKKCKVQHILLSGVTHPDEHTNRGLPHRSLLAREHVAVVRYKSFSFSSLGASICLRCGTGGCLSRASRQGSTRQYSGELSRFTRIN